jgi:hypothetical protein
MKLEQQLYHSSRPSVEENRKYFDIGDLEYLSASALYSGASINFSPGSFGGGFLKEKKSGSGSLNSLEEVHFPKPTGGSKPLSFPKIEMPKFSYEIPKVNSGPINVGGSKPLKLPEIDFAKFAEKYLGNLNLPKGGSKPLGFPKIEIRPAKKTEYFNLLDDSNQTIGITHHPVGLGKLKVYDRREDKEYGIPIIDIIDKNLRDWNFDLK